jgi:hypothetical protein
LARAEEDRSMFAKVPHVIDNKYFCFGCTKVFNFRCNYAIHLKDSKGKATSCAFATKETLPCYQLMDGRFYPVDPPLPPSSRSNIVSPAVHINRPTDQTIWSAFDHNQGPVYHRSHANQPAIWSPENRTSPI